MHAHWALWAIFTIRWKIENPLSQVMQYFLLQYFSLLLWQRRYIFVKNVWRAVRPMDRSIGLAFSGLNLLRGPSIGVKNLSRTSTSLDGPHPPDALKHSNWRGPCISLEMHTARVYMFMLQVFLLTRASRTVQTTYSSPYACFFGYPIERNSIELPRT